MKLLLLALMIATGTSFAGTKAGHVKKLKQGLIVGGAVVGGVVSWRLLKHCDHRLFEIFLDGTEQIARRSRMPLSRVTKVEVTDPPLYRLTAPDGSQHHIFGTMHISNLSLSDFPKDSELFPILEQANILMPEFAKARFTSALRHKLRLMLRVWKARSATAQQRLSEQLGQQHWEKLTQMISDHPEIKQFERQIDELMTVIDSSTANEVYRILVKYGSDYATPTDGLKMDFQLMRYGREHGKTLIGLETFKQGSSAMLKVIPELVANVDDLKKLIDKGGIDYVADTITDSVHHYAKGETISLDDFLLLPASSDKTAFYDIMLDQRNIAWVESGKIQKNCVNGNKCLIFVGAGHLDEGNNSLIKLLQRQGYQIDRL